MGEPDAIESERSSRPCGLHSALSAPELADPEGHADAEHGESERPAEQARRELGARRRASEKRRDDPAWAEIASLFPSRMQLVMRSCRPIKAGHGCIRRKGKAWIESHRLCGELRLHWRG